MKYVDKAFIVYLFMYLSFWFPYILNVNNPSVNWSIKKEGKLNIFHFFKHFSEREIIESINSSKLY